MARFAITGARIFSGDRFFDGHAVSYSTAELPGGLGTSTNNDYSYANLTANYPSPAPMWLLEQQN